MGLKGGKGGMGGMGGMVEDAEALCPPHPAHPGLSCPFRPFCLSGPPAYFNLLLISAQLTTFHHASM